MELQLQTEQTKPDWYDDLLARIWRTYMLLEELSEESQTEGHDLAVEALNEAPAGSFLSLQHGPYSRN